MIDIQVVIVKIEYIIYSLCRLRRAFRNQNTCFILIFSQVYDHMAVLETHLGSGREMSLMNDNLLRHSFIVESR